MGSLLGSSPSRTLPPPASPGMEIPLAEARYQHGLAAAPPLALASAANARAGGSPTVRSDGTVSSEAAEYSEHARLVSSALSDDGMTPLIQPARTRKQKLLLFWQRLLGFLLAHWSKAAILGVLITLIVLVSVKGFGFFGDVLTWFQRHSGWAGWGIFVGMYTAVVALFLPGVVLIVGAGFVFGFWRGLLAVWAGGAVGQALAFLLARYLFHGWVESTLKQKWAKWSIIDKAIEQDGWKLVLILRFSPIIPYNLLNIAMATTNIPFWQFTLVSAVGIVYECAVFAYFGSMADNIHSVISGDGGRPPWFEWVMLGVSAVMCVVGAVFVSYSIKQAVKRAQRHVSESQLGGEADDLEAAAGSDVGVPRLQPGYVGALEREGFVGSSSAGAGAGTPALATPGRGAHNHRAAAPYAASQGGDSPEFELKAVPGSSVGGGSSGEKARLLNGSMATAALLAVAAGTAGSSGTGSSGGGAGVGPRGSTKYKLSPQASSVELDPLARRFSSTEGGGGEENEASLSARVARRHPSVGGDSAL